MYVTPERFKPPANERGIVLSRRERPGRRLRETDLHPGERGKTAFEDSMANTRALLGAKDVQEL